MLGDNPSNAAWLFYLTGCVVLRYVFQRPCDFPRFPFCEVVGDTGQGEDRSTSGQPPDMEASETMLLQVSVGGLYRFAPESKHGITNFLHPRLKSFEQAV